MKCACAGMLASRVILPLRGSEIRQALRVNVASGDIVPVMMGSNLTNRGQFTMLTDVVKYLPSPADCKITGINANTNEVYEANYDLSKPKSAYVFKTIVDPFVGKYSLVKVNSGVLKTDDLLYNKHKESEEKIGKLYHLRALFHKKFNGNGIR